ncbi:MAG: glutamate 5-kinase [Myxococcota bacterium]
MDGGDRIRQALTEARRLVVKIGSRSLAHDRQRFAQLAHQVAAQREAGRTVVLVSSGAVALGGERLGLGGRPKSIARLQAAAAAGQSQLMRAYEDAFAPHGIPVAQVLLTHADMADRDRYLNARAAIDSLLELGAVPIINENDAVSVEEIRFGDNDQLAAMVATLVGADALVLLTDVEGVLDADGQCVRLVSDPTEVAHLVRAPADDVGLGGMASKLESARLATRRGVPVIVADARDARVLERVVGGEPVGTLFLPRGARLASRKHWIAFTLKPRGAILVDAGAAEALHAYKRSLLPAGVVGVSGDFDAGDAVRIVGPDGVELARGLARYAMRDVARLAGARTTEIEGRIGRYGGDEIVHRDDMVVHFDRC